MGQKPLSRPGIDGKGGKQRKRWPLKLARGCTYVKSKARHANSDEENLTDPNSDTQKKKKLQAPKGC